MPSDTDKTDSPLSDLLVDEPVEFVVQGCLRCRRTFLDEDGAACPACGYFLTILVDDENAADFGGRVR